MKSSTHNTSAAKDVFSYLFFIIVLYVSVISFIGIWWQCINWQFADALNGSAMSVPDSIRSFLSMMFIAWPLTLVMSWLIGKDIRAFPEKREARIRKWLLYLTLFITSVTMLIDLITLTNYFLNGEITTRFLLKVITVLLTSGAVFGYYLWDLKQTKDAGGNTQKAVGIVATLLVLVSIVTSFILVGSPATQRAMRFDQTRVQNLQSIQGQLVSYWSIYKDLPSTTEELNSAITGFAVPTDPESDVAYEYTKKDATHFALCATFSKPSDNRFMVNSYPEYGVKETYWTHEAGHACFDRTINTSDVMMEKPIPVR